MLKAGQGDKISDAEDKEKQTVPLQNMPFSPTVSQVTLIQNGLWIKVTWETVGAENTCWPSFVLLKVRNKYPMWKVPFLYQEGESIPVTSDWRTCLQCRRPGFDPWVRKIPWRRKWQPTPVFLVCRIPWTEEPGGQQSIRSQKSCKKNMTKWLEHKQITRDGELRAEKTIKANLVTSSLIYYPSRYFFVFQFFRDLLFLCLKGIKSCLFWSCLWVSIFYGALLCTKLNLFFFC